MPVVVDIVKKDSLVAKIDSIVLWKIDTLSDAKFTERHIINQYRKVESYLEISKSFRNQASLEISQAKLNRQQAELYGGILESTTLQRIAIEDEDKNIKDYREHLTKSQTYLDSATNLNNEINKLDSNLKAKKINTKNFIDNYGRPVYCCP